MRPISGRLILPLLAPLALAACMDNAPSALPAEPELPLQAALSPGDCTLSKDLAQAARSWFPRPERNDAASLAQDLHRACTREQPAAVKTNALALLDMMETMLNEGRGGPAGDGSSLANVLLACTRGLCNPAGNPGLDLVAALQHAAGVFAIRHGSEDSRPVQARSWTPFSDGVADNHALWGIDVDAPWAEVANADPVLLYGTPVSTLQLLDPGLGGLQYDFNRWPAVGLFDDELHVWVCFADEAGLPHAPDVEPEGRMQRESTLLEDYTPNCPQYVASSGATLATPFMRLARAILPQPLHAFAMRTDRGVRHIGGSPLDFSRFAPVGANPDGELEWEVPPASVVTVGGALNVQVRARTGSGTPIEKVRVILEVAGNQGAPAGAFVSDNEALTREADGIAVFDKAAVNKPGGYTICARGELDGFTFEPVCSTMFHARNN